MKCSKQKKNKKEMMKNLQILKSRCYFTWKKKSSKQGEKMKKKLQVAIRGERRTRI